MTLTDMAAVIEQLPELVRKRRGTLTLREAAAQAGVCYNAIARCERGEIPRARTIAHLLRWVDTPAVN